jgi:heme exporter protein D
MSEFFAMGGYAFYVWTSYLLTALVLGANILAPWLALKRLRRRLAGGTHLRGKRA